jgi:hypothetical protein
MGAERGKWGRRSRWLTHSSLIGFSTLIRREGGWDFPSQFKIFCSIEELPSACRVGGGGGCTSAACRAAATQTIGNSKDDSLNDYAS